MSKLWDKQPGEEKEDFLNQIRISSERIAGELLEQAKLNKGDIVVVGCSSSEVRGEQIGTSSSLETAQAIFQGIYKVIMEKELFLAAQCCEHLNRTLIIEKELALRERLPIVNVVPMPKAGGSFGTAAYAGFKEPVAVEAIRARAGIDIGDTLIGMHLQEVAVPVRITTKTLGSAHVVCARSRARFVGGIRAVYNEDLM